MLASLEKGVTFNTVSVHCVETNGGGGGGVGKKLQVCHNVLRDCFPGIFLSVTK